MVVVPPGHDPAKIWPTCYEIHNFGGWGEVAAGRWGRSRREAMERGEIAPMLHVCLKAACPRGHHEFADSVNNGPCGKALIEELIPAIERELGGHPGPEGRFLAGHSSGGWSSLWLQVTYPDFFGGCWSIAPDPVDFRDFSGIDIYKYESAYVDPLGKEIHLTRIAGKWARTIRQFVEEMEPRNGGIGGQFSSFDYVFSPRGDNGLPQPLFDRASGKIDRSVASAWEKYDISLILQGNWKVLGPKLRGKLHVYCGLEDTYRLEGASRLLKQELERIGSDAEVVLLEGRDHGSIFDPHQGMWPDGLWKHVWRQMWERYQAHIGSGTQRPSPDGRDR